MLRLCVLLFFLSFDASAQSVSPWKKIGPATFGDVSDPHPGTAYMTVVVRKATAYQDSNFWTNMVERKRQSVLTINLSGTVAGTPFALTKVGLPIQLRKNKTMVDLGFSGTVVDHLPMTFTSLNMSLLINKTADDGLQEMISMVSAMTTTQPAVVSINQQTMGAINLTKSLADFLFKKQLLVNQLTTQSPLSGAGLLPPGIYICFAGDTANHYQHYLSAGSDLTWDGVQAVYRNAPLNGVTYFVVEVGYQSKYFTNPTDALAFGATRPWVTLFLLAEAKIQNISSSAEAPKVRGDISAHLSDALSLLHQDYDFTQVEKQSIYDAVWTRNNNSYNKRLAELPVPVPGVQNLAKDTLSTTTETVLATIQNNTVVAAGKVLTQ